MDRENSKMDFEISAVPQRMNADAGVVDSGVSAGLLADDVVRGIVAHVDRADIDGIVYLQRAPDGKAVAYSKEDVASWHGLLPDGCTRVSPGIYLAHCLVRAWVDTKQPDVKPKSLMGTLIPTYYDCPSHGARVVSAARVGLLMDQFGQGDRALMRDMQRVFSTYSGVKFHQVLQQNHRKRVEKIQQPEPSIVTADEPIMGHEYASTGDRIPPTQGELRPAKTVMLWDHAALQQQLCDIGGEVKACRKAIGWTAQKLHTVSSRAHHRVDSTLTWPEILSFELGRIGGRSYINRPDYQQLSGFLAALHQGFYHQLAHVAEGSAEAVAIQRVLPKLDALYQQVHARAPELVQVDSRSQALQEVQQIQAELKALGGQVSACRKMLGWEMDALAAQRGIPTLYLTQLEAGKIDRRHFKFERAAPISAMLGKLSVVFHEQLDKLPRDSEEARAVQKLLPELDRVYQQVHLLVGVQAGYVARVGQENVPQGVARS